MKIALIGYGKMGQMIASVAKERGHEIVIIVESQKSKVESGDVERLFGEIDSEAFRSADVAIEFTRPEAA